jgi:hypothetical protein
MLWLSVFNQNLHLSVNFHTFFAFPTQNDIGQGACILLKKLSDELDHFFKAILIESGNILKITE